MCFAEAVFYKTAIYVFFYNNKIITNYEKLKSYLEMLTLNKYIQNFHVKVHFNRSIRLVSRDVFGLAFITTGFCFHENNFSEVWDRKLRWNFRWTSKHLFGPLQYFQRQVYFSIISKNKLVFDTNIKEFVFGLEIGTYLISNILTLIYSIYIQNIERANY